MDAKERITYRQGPSAKDAARYLKAIALPAGLFLLALLCVSRLAGFGTGLVAPLTGAMWAIGVICALLVPSQRNSILRETYVTVGCYLVGLMALREAIALVSGISSEALMAAYNQALPLTSGSTFSGYLQTSLWIAAIMTPVGFTGLEAKKVFTFRRRGSKNRTLDQLRGIRSNTGHTL